MLKHFIIIILVTLSGFLRTDAQELRQVIDYADHEFSAGRYEQAGLEYQRALIFSLDSLHPYLQSQIGACFFSLNDFERAGNYFGAAAANCPDDSLRLENLFRKISCLILGERFYTALDELSRIHPNHSDYFNRKRSFLSGICNWGNFKYEDAFSFFLQTIPSDETERRRDLLALQSEFRQGKGPYPRLASVLSLLPGAGQVYAGDIRAGLNSFLLCGFLGVAGYYSVIATRSNIILLNLIPWIQRYYVGGILHAGNLAESHQDNRKSEFFDQIMQLMELSED